MADNQDWPSTRETLIGSLQADPKGPEWGTFSDVYIPIVHRFCRRRGLQEADAQDVTQNVFLEVRKSIKGFMFDPAQGRFRSWLRTITIREIDRYGRKRTRAGEPTEGATDGKLSGSDDEALWVVIFNEHIGDIAIKRIEGGFEEATWQAFVLLWKGHKTPTEVSQILKKPIDWVYQAKYRVLRRLEKEVLILTADTASFTKGEWA